MDKSLKKICVIELFKKDIYQIPTYQRNFAWDDHQIIQLIDDIETSNSEYFLGTLIVNHRENDTYEVIDGQQRLTTLFLLGRYLGIPFSNYSLRFDARVKSNRTLSHIIEEEYLKSSSDDLYSSSILDGYQVIQNYFESKEICAKYFMNRLGHVHIIRVQVPKGINLNQYFEIMNTRGEQLESHEIIKARILENLNRSDKKIAAMIWEVCSNMNSYVQMNFKKSERNKIFDDKWIDLKEIEDFDSLANRLLNLVEGETEVEPEDLAEKKQLIDILKCNKTHKKNNLDLNEENERFESSISFSNFILQVNCVINGSEEEDTNLDDKQLIDNLSWIWQSEDSEKNSKEFIFSLLECRILFDRFIIKRELTERGKSTRKWSLQRLEKYEGKPQYLATYGHLNDQLRTLQSCLRITYTSPKTMHWISLVLSNVRNGKQDDLISILENYAENKVVGSQYKIRKGFKFERIVFTYLDYLLYRDGYSITIKGIKKQLIKPLNNSWHFQFRNSMEHFFPQHPKEGTPWEEKDLNCFGNLVLITSSANSTLSNISPRGKVDTYSKIINQSLKFEIMGYIANIRDWDEKIALKHEEEMFKILDNR